MKIIIEKAEISDLDEIKEVTKKLNSHLYYEYDKSININFATSDGGDRYLKRSVDGDSGGVVFVAKNENDKLIGFVLAVIEKVGDFRIINEQCELDFLWVDDEYRRQGIAKRFIEKVENWCIDKEIKTLLVTVDVLNKNALDLYKEKSFKERDLTLEKEL